MDPRRRRRSPQLWGCLIGGGVMTAYFTAGGLLPSAWVNLVELVVLVGARQLGLAPAG